MHPAFRLAAFAGTLAVLFAAGALMGDVMHTERTSEPAAHGSVRAPGKTSDEAPAHGDGRDAAGKGEPAGAHGASGGAVRAVRGLAVAEDGLRLVVDDPGIRRGRRERLRFRVVDREGRTVRDFDVEHTKRMHVIVARRDLSGFQHLHPTQAADGSWDLPLELDEAGSYRLFADFTHEGEASTLATDLRVDGTADLGPLPGPAPTATSDGGYDVRLDEVSPAPGDEADLRFTVTRDGRPIHVEPYLGAGGHLVALREGDLAYLHVHPSGRHEGEPDAEEHDDGIAFAATFPTQGRYRLFLQFKHEGRVQTVAFTQEVR